MNTTTKKVCGAVLGLVLLCGAAFSASAATGTYNRGLAMNTAAVANVGGNFGFHHHRRYWYWRHHRRYYYWR